MRQAWRRVVLLTGVAVLAACASASADLDSQPTQPAAGQIGAGRYHSCAARAGVVRCWGYAGDAQLGYANVVDIGDDEVPAAAGPLDLGADRTASSISVGAYHSCAVLNNATLRCWGFGGDGRLGYANTAAIGDNETPADAGPVDLGDGRTATAVSAGTSSTCAVLDHGSVRCWGYPEHGRLGYGNQVFIGDTETPGSVGPVDLGDRRTATVVTVGDEHACALLDGGDVRCWGLGSSGQLGYGNFKSIGDNETPGSAGPVYLGAGRTAKAITAGDDHTCAVLDDGAVRCWGFGAEGQLGYANTSDVGVTQTPGSIGPVDIGAGRKAKAISAGARHTCAILDNGSVRCWGSNSFGQLGLASSASTLAIGDDETPGSVAPIDLGAGRTAIAIAAGDLHTCATLDDSSIRCWGAGTYGQLGLCGRATVGDDEVPGSVGPVDIGFGGAACPIPGTGGSTAPPLAPVPPTVDTSAATGAAPAPIASGPAADDAAQQAQTARARQLRACLRTAAQRPKRLRAGARRSCLARYGRTPARVVRLRAAALSKTSVRLTFEATGSDARNAPAARHYLVKQSLRPIRTRSEFLGAQALCNGACKVEVSAVGTRIELTVTDLRPATTYYFKVAGRDNVSQRQGARSVTAKVRMK